MGGKHTFFIIYFLTIMYNMETEQAAEKTVQDLSQVVKDVIVSADTDKIVKDSVELAVDVVHDVSICCGLFRTKVSTTKQS